MIPPVGEPYSTAERLNVPTGVELLLNPDGEVMSNDIKQPLVVPSVHPDSVPANTLMKR
jgi:hypothetical protein